MGTSTNYVDSFFISLLISRGEGSFQMLTVDYGGGGVWLLITQSFFFHFYPIEQYQFDNRNLNHSSQSTPILGGPNYPQ